MPTSDAVFDGETIEPSVSVPTATAPRLAATAAPEPELEPDGLRSSAYGFRVCPPRPLHPLDECVDRKFAHSLRFVLPRITAPAARRRPTTNASAGGRRAGERQRAGRRHHAIAGGDVVLDQNRNAVERPAHAAGPAFGVEGVGDRRGVRVDLEDAAQLGAAPVDRVDPRQVFLDERPRRLLAGFHPLLQIGDRHLVEIERRGRGRLRRQRRDRQRGGGRQRDQSFPLSHDSSFVLHAITAAHTRQPIITAAPRNCVMFAIR